MKDVIEILAKAVAIVGGLIAAFKLLEELRENRKQRVRELRWKQSNSAHELLKELYSSKEAKDATIMIDWTGRNFNIAPNESEIITFDDIREALKITDISFNSKEVYIRDCMDAFLFHIEIIEQAIQNELTQFKDIQYHIEYYIKTLIKNNLLNEFKIFIKEYGYTNADYFFNRFSLHNSKID